ncbi:MAG: hypothetical protein NZO58_00330 [Gemmataceae bacterium]|nr:hypothetical protein [Gemmataceae bacterium]
MLHHLARLANLGLLVMTGCTTLWPGGDHQLTQPAPSAEVQQASWNLRKEFPGKVHLFRGGAGIFSLGMDTLGKRLSAAGVDNEVHFHSQCWFLADRIARECANLDGPLILGGHSWGADAALRLAHLLDARRVPIDLIVTIDPTTPPTVPKNVRRVVNIYRDSGAWDVVPIWRGVPLEKAPDAAHVRLENIHVQEHPDLNLPGLSHSTIDDNPIIQQEVIKQILKTCKGA